ncbi:MAG TPA: glycosyltransferase [Actinomycetes bacterium]|nr:glycosyltransferase [Actinomycetes bacterium]
MAEPLRVLFIAHAFPRAAGDLPGSFVLRLAEALRGEGVAVTALAPAAPGAAACERLAGVEVRRYRYAPARLETIAYTGGMHHRATTGGGLLATAGLLGAGSLAAGRHGRHAGLVHAHWWVPGGLQALASGRRPLVTTLHGTDLRLALRNPAARAACARVLRASARITTVSTWLADQAARIAPAAAARVRVAPMPVDEEAFRPPPDGAPRDELLFVGRLDAQKGLDDALRALPRLTGRAAALPLRVVGHGPELAALQRLAGRLGVAGRVRWEPYAPPAELAGRYRRAAALLVPSRAEGLGLVAVEAQLSGTPVVAAAAGGLVDVVADGRTGRTFPPGEPAALAAAASALLDDPAAAAALTGRARRSALERFSRAASARAYAAVYAEALAGRAGTGGRPA